MATTKCDQAIAAANSLIGIAASIRTLKAQVDDLVNNYNNEGWSTIWGALATAAQNADGSLGTADGSPNTAHPIDTRVATQTALAKAVSQAKLVAGIVALQQFQNLLNNGAVTQAAYLQSINDLAS